MCFQPITTAVPVTRQLPVKLIQFCFSPKNNNPNKYTIGTSKVEMSNAGPALQCCNARFKQHCPANPETADNNTKNVPPWLRSESDTLNVPPASNATGMAIKLGENTNIIKCTDVPSKRITTRLEEIRKALANALAQPHTCSLRIDCTENSGRDMQTTPLRDTTEQTASVSETPSESTTAERSIAITGLQKKMATASPTGSACSE